MGEQRVVPFGLNLQSAGRIVGKKKLADRSNPGGPGKEQKESLDLARVRWEPGKICEQGSNGVRAALETD